MDFTQHAHSEFFEFSERLTTDSPINMCVWILRANRQSYAVTEVIYAVLK